MFNNLFGSKEEALHQQWKRLVSEDQLDQIDADSKEKPVVLFKHSTSCGISAMAKYKLEKEWDFELQEMDFYYLDLWAYRPLSNEVANRYQVIHQSPQIIIIKDGQAVYDASHHMVNVATLKNHL